MAEKLYSWVCPACARRVPNRLTTCRCGFEMDPALIGGAEPDGDASDAGAGGALGVGRMLGGAVLIVALAGYLVTRLYGPDPAPVQEAYQGPASFPQDPSPSNIARPAAVPGAGPLTTADISVPSTGPAIPPPALLPLPPPGPVGGAPAGGALEDVISGAVSGVVAIETRDGRGSGFFVGPGTILTNNHVVAGNVSVTVRLSSGATMPGRVERTSAEADLAIVRVDSAPAGQVILPLGSANTVRVGQEVIAIGLAMGQFQGTVTRGIISAVRRAGTDSQIVLLQTDAAINPGNSGGPLIDRNGRVVGITTLKVAGNAESLGFAVAADHAQAFLAGSSPRTASIATAAAPSAAPSAPLAPAFTPRSESDVRRDEGLQLFDQSLGTVATRAAQIDSFWTQIKDQCNARATGVYEREWFGIWEGRVSMPSADPGCLSAFTSLRQAADGVREAMTQLHEGARRSGVYPGDVRRSRSKFSLDWNGWDR